MGVFSGRCTSESLPLRVDFIHRVEFGEVSGHGLELQQRQGRGRISALASRCSTAGP